MVKGRTRHVDRLLEQMNRGSEHAFSQFYDAHIDLVFRVALNMMGDLQEAEDVCHDVFLEVYQKPGSYDPKRGSIEAWLAVKTRSRCLDRLRKKMPVCLDSVEHIADSGEPAPSAESIAMRRAEQQAVQHALRDIPSKQREVLVHTYYHERTQRELAAELNDPVGTIKSRIRYGLQNLKKRLLLLGWVPSDQGGE